MIIANWVSVFSRDSIASAVAEPPIRLLPRLRHLTLWFARSYCSRIVVQFHVQAWQSGIFLNASSRIGVSPLFAISVKPARFRAYVSFSFSVVNCRMRQATATTDPEPPEIAETVFIRQPSSASFASPQWRPDHFLRNSKRKPDGD